MIKESKGNMYEFVTHTWNPIKGKCFHGCTYCYMKKMCTCLKAPRLDAAELTSYLECSNEDMPLLHHLNQYSTSSG